VNWILSNVTEPIGQLFLRVLLMTVIPLVFSSLVVGVAGLGDVRKLGRNRTEIVRLLRGHLGDLGRHWTGPCECHQAGEANRRCHRRRFAAALRRGRAEGGREAKKGGTTDSVAMQVIKTLVPAKPDRRDRRETPNMLHLMFFAVMFGVAMTLAGSERTAGLLSALEGLYAVSAKIIDLIMQVAPYRSPVCSQTTRRVRLDLLAALGWFG